MPLSPKPVDCECPEEFVLDILDYLPGSVRMAGCTWCGRTDLANPIITEDRPHDVQFFGYQLVDLSAEVRTWASAWPRFIVVDERRVYLPAGARFESIDQRAAAIAGAAAQQAGLPLKKKLVALGIPPFAPPESMPASLSGFVEMWNGLQLNDATPLDELLDAAMRFNGPNRLAKDVLACRRDLQQLAWQLLWDSNEVRRAGGRLLVEEFHLSGPEILAPLCDRLGAMSDNHTGEMERICTLLRAMGPAAIHALPDLEAAALRVEKKDYYAHLDVKRAIQVLEAARSAKIDDGG